MSTCMVEPRPLRSITDDSPASRSTFLNSGTESVIASAACFGPYTMAGIWSALRRRRPTRPVPSRFVALSVIVMIRRVCPILSSKATYVLYLMGLDAGDVLLIHFRYGNY